MNNKPLPVIGHVQLTFMVGKGQYTYSFQNKECVRNGFGPMSKSFPLDMNSVNDKMAKEFAETIHRELN